MKPLKKGTYLFFFELPSHPWISNVHQQKLNINKTGKNVKKSSITMLIIKL